MCSPKCEHIDGCNLLGENTTGFICVSYYHSEQGLNLVNKPNFGILNAISHVFTEVATSERVTSPFTGIPTWFYLFNCRLFTADEKLQVNH